MNETDRVTPLPVSSVPASGDPASGGGGTDEASLEHTFTRTEHAALDRASSDRSLAREHAHAALGLGLIRLEQRRFDDALAKLERAVKIFSVEANVPPELCRAHLGAAEVHARTGFDELAKQHLRAAKRVLRKVPPETKDELSEALSSATERITNLPAEPLAAASAGPAKRYRHSKFGDGTLLDRRDNNLHVRFDDDGVERWLVADRLTLLED